jgi:hypothetical protein
MKGIRTLAAILVLAGCSTYNPAITHVGQPIDQHVTLRVLDGEECGTVLAPLDFERIMPDGRRVVGYFRVPKGKVFVVTDVDWGYVHPEGAAGAGKLQFLRLYIQNIADPRSTYDRAFESPIVLSSQGEGGASVAM